MNRTFISKSDAETENIASELAAKLRGGELIELASDLGGGKTTFTRGLVRGLDSPDQVASPTFTISREYSNGRLHVYHFDLYRLAEAGIVGDELSEVVGDPLSVVVLEWAGVAQNILPNERVTVTIKPVDDTTRELRFSCPDTLNYLIKDDA